VTLHHTMTCPDLRMTRAAGIGHAVPGMRGKDRGRGDPDGRMPADAQWHTRLKGGTAELCSVLAELACAG